MVEADVVEEVEAGTVGRIGEADGKEAETSAVER